MHSISDLLANVVKNEASDLFITVGSAPLIKVGGVIVPVKGEDLTARESRELCYSIMNESQRRDFEADKECNFAIHPKKLGRFRVNVFMQQGSVGMVLRYIKSDIPNFQQLRLPDVLKKVALHKLGMVIFVGGTGSGKSTSMAALMDYRNSNMSGHIITIEDPVEFVHSHKKSVVTQREVGIDTDSFENALVNTLRQAPDVIQIGEIRTPETMEKAIAFSETGHLCIATLHANNAVGAIDRIINFFSEERKEQLLNDLASNLYAVISQRLLPTKDGKGRVAALEILICSPLISDMIREDRIEEIYEVIERSGEEWGMQTFDQALFEIFEDGLVTYEDAMKNANSQNNLRLKIKLEGKNASVADIGSSLSDVDLVDDDDDGF
ncbi:MAG: PilT/PilU family type 4a pilus ATPase [Arenicella sp.]